MKSRKENNRDQQIKTNGQSGATVIHGMKRNKKAKYKHKGHWLKQEDDDYELPKYKDEEE